MMEITHSYCLCKHESHKIILREDGSVETPDHPDAVAQGQRLAAFARLGRPVDVQGCATVAALVFGAGTLCQHWASNTTQSAPAPWRTAMETFRVNKVVAFAMVAAQAKLQARHDAIVIRLMAELGKCSWFLGQPFDVATGLRSDDLRAWGEVGTLDSLGLPSHHHLRIPLQSYWLDLANNGDIVYNDKLIVGDEYEDAKTVYAIHRDADAERRVLKVSAFRRDTRMKKLERA